MPFGLLILGQKMYGSEGNAFDANIVVYLGAYGLILVVAFMGNIVVVGVRRQGGQLKEGKIRLIYPESLNGCFQLLPKIGYVEQHYGMICLKKNLNKSHLYKMECWCKYDLCIKMWNKLMEIYMNDCNQSNSFAARLLYPEHCENSGCHNIYIKLLSVKCCLCPAKYCKQCSYLGYFDGNYFYCNGKCKRLALSITFDSNV